MNTAAITARPDAAAWLGMLHARTVDRLPAAADRVLLQSCSLHLATIGGWPVLELQTAEGRPVDFELQKSYGKSLAGVLADAGAGLTVLDPPSDAAADAAAGLAGLWSRVLERVDPMILVTPVRWRCRLLSVDALTATVQVPDQGALSLIGRSREAIEQALAEVLGQRVALAVVVAEPSDATPEG